MKLFKEIKNWFDNLISKNKSNKIISLIQQNQLLSENHKVIKGILLIIFGLLILFASPLITIVAYGAILYGLYCVDVWQLIKSLYNK